MAFPSEAISEMRREGKAPLPSPRKRGEADSEA